MQLFLAFLKVLIELLLEPLVNIIYVLIHVAHFVAPQVPVNII